MHWLDAVNKSVNAIAYRIEIRHGHEFRSFRSASGVAWMNKDGEVLYRRLPASKVEGYNDWLPDIPKT